MVMEYAAGGSLFSIINDPLLRKELLPSGRLYVANALDGSLEYLHSKNVFHRDIKAENVCLRKGWKELPQVLLIDFGIASKIAKGAAHKTVTSNPGTLIYMAPEYLRLPYTYTAKSEVYSVGLVLVSLLQGTCFFTMAADEYTEDTLLVALDALAGPWKANSDSDLAKLAIACVCHDPEQRPSVKNLREHLKAIRGRMSAQLDPQISKRITAYQSCTRPSRGLKEAGTAKHPCVCCGITRKDGGVLCSRNHFTCMAGMCLEETVRESIGSNTIQCCANKCSKTFPLADTYGKVGADIYGQFLMTMDQNNDRKHIQESIMLALEDLKHTYSQLKGNGSSTNSTNLSNEEPNVTRHRLIHP
jgi:serine/threonine protein kinase